MFNNDDPYLKAVAAHAKRGEALVCFYHSRRNGRLFHAQSIGCKHGLHITAIEPDRLGETCPEGCPIAAAWVIFSPARHALETEFARHAAEDIELNPPEACGCDPNLRLEYLRPTKPHVHTMQVTWEHETDCDAPEPNPRPTRFMAYPFGTTKIH